MSDRPLGGVLLLGALTILWGGNWPAMKLALQELDPWTFRTVCLLVGGGGLLALVRASGQNLRVPQGERWPLALVAFFNITAWHLCSAYGLTLVQAGRAASSPTRCRCGPWSSGAAVSWAIGTVLTKANPWTIPTAVLTGWQLVLGAVPIVLGAAVRHAGSGDAGPLSRLGSLSSGALLGTAYATLVGVIFCHWAWFRLVAILPAAVAAIGTLGIPIVGLFTSALGLGEPVGSAEVVALVLVVAGLGILVSGLRGGAPESLPGPRTVPSTRRESP